MVYLHVWITFKSTSTIILNEFYLDFYHIPMEPVETFMALVWTFSGLAVSVLGLYGSYKVCTNSTWDIPHNRISKRGVQ